ncbi:acyl carrier protein [Paenibacillus sp. SYP-B4298]|uniref:acyl carrier protein n=1 Tax=Paenibacillus sp. SYP-B4298 TaxID=2996034 RepID=UPI0022DD13B7|nr:acyl carrier protein [Paenibacillus sp. SYP-B4298]
MISTYEDTVKAVSAMIRDVVAIHAEFGPEDDLRELGLHSIAAITLVVEIEKQYEIEYNDDELLLGNFATIAIIVAGIQRKLQEKGRG